MTDRERLLEQIEEAEKRADEQGLCSVSWLGHAARAEHGWERGVHFAKRSAKRAWHHALTALALRDMIGVFDEVAGDPGPWRDEGLCR